MQLLFNKGRTIPFSLFNNSLISFDPQAMPRICNSLFISLNDQGAAYSCHEKGWLHLDIIQNLSWIDADIMDSKRMQQKTQPTICSCYRWSRN